MTNPTPRLTEAELDRLGIAIHEAGHAVAAVVLGGRIHQATMGQRPRTEYAERLPGGTEPAVTYAGPWAEARWTLGRHPGPADMRRVLTRNSADEQVLTAAGGWHEGAQVVPLLERSWGAVKTMAKHLYFQGTASHQDVCAALGLSDEGGPGSLGLALLRSNHLR